MKDFIKYSLTTFALLFALSVTPADAEAQLMSCGFCDSSGSSATCSQSNEPSLLLCTDVFLWVLCTGCEVEQTALPAAVTPDGSLLGESDSPLLESSLSQYGEEVYPGVFVARASCNGMITQRWYAHESEAQLRDESRTLTL